MSASSRRTCGRVHPGTKGANHHNSSPNARNEIIRRSHLPVVKRVVFCDSPNAPSPRPWMASGVRRSASSRRVATPIEGRVRARPPCGPASAGFRSRGVPVRGRARSARRRVRVSKPVRGPRRGGMPHPVCESQVETPPSNIRSVMNGCSSGRRSTRPRMARVAGPGWYVRPDPGRGVRASGTSSRCTGARHGRLPAIDEWSTAAPRATRPRPRRPHDRHAGQPALALRRDVPPEQ